jgi:hypothetical protein
MVNITEENQKVGETLKGRIKELQEIAEQLEEAFPRLDEDDAKIVNSLCRKLVDRLSSAHDVSLKLEINLERIKSENER